MPPHWCVVFLYQLPAPFGEMEYLSLSCLAFPAEKEETGNLLKSQGSWRIREAATYALWWCPRCWVEAQHGWLKCPLAHEFPFGWEGGSDLAGSPGDILGRKNSRRPRADCPMFPSSEGLGPSCSLRNSAHCPALRRRPQAGDYYSCRIVG